MTASLRVSTLLIFFAITFYPFICDADDTGDVENEAYCRMEIRYYLSFDSCFDLDTIATAFVYADGKCHSVKTDLNPSDKTYTLLPGIYRLECSSDNTLIFRDSACLSGTCSEDETCQRDGSSLGRLYSLEVGQQVQDPLATDSHYCERLSDARNNSMIFAVFGDCSQPGCSVNGSINPISSSPPNNSPTAVQAGAPTRTPIASANYTERTPTDSPFISYPTRSPTVSPTQIPIQSPIKPPSTATEPPSDTVTQESSGSKNHLVLLAAIGGSVSVVALQLML